MNCVYRFKQHKHNLLREETEGFSKLVLELHLFFTDHSDITGTSARPTIGLVHC